MVARLRDGNPEALGLRGIAFAALLLAAQLAFAAEPPPERWSRMADTVFRHLDQDNGLPSSIATAFAQDAQGFVWVGTQSGLARWDGYRFRVYRADAAEPGALPNPFVNVLHVDAQRRLWVGTNGGLARYDADRDRFVSFVAEADGLVDARVLAIADDGEGGLWIATTGGLDRLIGATGKVAHQEPGGASALPSGRVGVVMRDRGGALWIGSTTGLFRRRPGEAQFGLVPMPSRQGPVPLVERLFEDGAGNMWIGTRRDGAYRLDAGAESARAVRASGNNDIASENVSAFAEASPGRIWIGTFGNGIIVADSATGATYRIRRDRTLAQTLADNTVWALMRDRSGLVWTGSNRGISLHNTQRAALMAVFGGADRRDGVTDTEIFSVAAAADGRVWLGLGTNGVDVIDPDAGRVAELRPDPANPENALPKDRVWSIAAAPDGTVWLGTNRGLYRSDAAARRVQRVVIPGRSVVENTQCLLLDGDTLYVGGTAGGLWDYDTAKRASRQLIGDALASEGFITMAKGVDRGGSAQLWVATPQGLLSVIPASGPPGVRVQRVAATDLGGITSMLTDRKGRLWIGTDSGELQVMTETDPENPVRRRVGSPGRNRGIDKLLEDARGNIWASTDEGLMVVDGATFETRAFSRADGDAFTAGYWADSGTVTAGGELVFGALGGLTIVRPDRGSAGARRPSIAISELRVGGAAVPSYPHMGPDAGAVTIAPGSNNLAVEFSALEYATPERIRYSYRMEGVDGDWIATDATRRLATYANLAPGDYALRMRGGDGGDNAASELRLAVTVLPAWYQTWWWRLTAAFATLALLYGVVRLRTAALEQRRRELELKVGERTAQLEQASKALEEASLTDALTGMRNRRFATQHLDADAGLAVRRYEQNKMPHDADLVFYLIDIDHFKQVNDVHGHAAGDAVLVQLPARLARIFRETDYIVRWGGEEFLVVERGTSRKNASERCERIRAAVADTTFELPGGTRLAKTCSIGYCAFPLDPSAPRAAGWQDAVELADRALYEAKRAGRNRWVGPEGYTIPFSA